MSVMGQKLSKYAFLDLSLAGILRHTWFFICTPSAEVEHGS